MGEEFLSGELIVLGQILHLVDGFYIVKSSTNQIVIPDQPVSNENRLIVGIIDDIMGSIDEPYYSIKQIQQANTGDLLYFSNQQQVLFKLAHTPGTDASKWNDQEASDHSSDDEEPKQNFPVKRNFRIFDTPPNYEDI